MKDQWNQSGIKRWNWLHKCQSLFNLPAQYMTWVLQTNIKNKTEHKKKTAEERSQGLGHCFWKGYIVHFMDAVFVNEPGIERGQI